MAAGLSHFPLHSRTLVIERNERRVAEGKAARPVPPEGAWVASTILSILRNPRYAGYSVYTKKKARKLPVGESRRKALRDNIVRDENNEPVLGQWEPLIEADQWWTVQNLLDDPARVTNRTGSTVRKHLGAGLYLCEDAKDAYSQRIAEQRARIARAERDYDAEIIEGADLARIRDAARAEIQRLEAERLASGTGVILGHILGVKDPAQAFLDAPMAQQRTLIDTLMTVTLKKAKQGHKGFDPTSVVIEWKQ